MIYSIIDQPSHQPSSANIYENSLGLVNQYRIKIILKMFTNLQYRDILKGRICIGEKIIDELSMTSPMIYLRSLTVFLVVVDGRNARGWGGECSTFYHHHRLHVRAKQFIGVQH